MTGNGVYKYYKLKDNGLRVEHSQMNKKEAHVSNHFTCHTWLPDGRLLVCTDQGEILWLEGNGEYKMLLTGASDGIYIENIITYSKGFIIAGDKIMVYEKGEDPKNPYTRLSIWPQFEAKQEKENTQLMLSTLASRIKSMALNSTEDNLIFTTENN